MNYYKYDEKVGHFPSDWNLCKVGSLGEFYGGSTPPTTDKKNWDGNIVWLVPSDLTAISEASIRINDSETKITEAGFRSCSTVMLPVGTLCISSRATIGEAAIADIELCTNQGFINVVTDKKYDPVYLLYWVKHNKNYISRYGAGTTFLEIGRRSFRKLKIALPQKLQERKAIAGILSKVDEAIDTFDNSIKAAERLKKSLMQNLLTGKLKPDGTWRTQDNFYTDEKFGQIPLGWIIEKGNKITDKITKGQSPKWQGFEYGKSGMLFITSENVRDGYLDISAPKYLPIAFNGKIRNSQLMNGDILINIVGASIGRSCVFNGEAEVANINQAVCLFRLSNGYHNDFFAYYFQHPLTVHRLLCNQVETARANLSLGDFRKLKFLFPENIEEQKAIAKKISGFNSVLQAKQTKIQSLKTLKKSLMQNLLTGKVRVDVEKINQMLGEVN